MAQELIDYYDEEVWGEPIVDKTELWDREKKSLDIINTRLPKKGKFLDIGCGTGYFMQQLDDSGSKLDLHGVDYSKYCLDVAKKNGLPYTFKRCNIEEGIPYKDGFFDVIYAAELIEHLVNPDYFAKECNRLLKRSGTLIVTTPNLVAWYNRILLLFGVQPMFYESSTLSPKIGSGKIMRRIKQGDIPVGHIRIFTIRAMIDLLESQGFRITLVKGAHFASLPRTIRWIDDIFTIYPRLSSGMIVVAQKK